MVQARDRPFSLIGTPHSSARYHQSGWGFLEKGSTTMNIRKLCTNGAVAVLVAAGAVAIAAPAEARLACNQYGTCWWTGDTPDAQRDNSDYYAQKWGVHIRNGDREDYDHYRGHGYHHARFHGNVEFNNGYYYRDRDYDNDYDRY